MKQKIMLLITVVCILLAGMFAIAANSNMKVNKNINKELDVYEEYLEVDEWYHAVLEQYYKGYTHLYPTIEEYLETHFKTDYKKYKDIKEKLK